MRFIYQIVGRPEQGRNPEFEHSIRNIQRDIGQNVNFPILILTKSVSRDLGIGEISTISQNTRLDKLIKSLRCHFPLNSAESIENAEKRHSRSDPNRVFRIFRNRKLICAK